MTYVRVSDDGRYGLAAPGPNDHGYHTLFRIVTPDPVDPEFVDYPVGAVADPENFETAIDEADEESRVLMAQAREEFGF